MSGATIFLAHSTLDIKAARRVRNLFEDLDHDVLLLKLSQEMTTAYLRELLTREIQARDWLVMIKSKNAEQSRWVDLEKSFARERHKPVFTIDLEECSKLQDAALLPCLKRQVAAVSRSIRVFLSYSRRDAEIARRLSTDLQGRGFEVWYDKAQLRPGVPWEDEIKQAIDRVLEKGALVCLLSKASLSSAYAMHEVRHALAQNGRVIPCVLERPDVVPPELQSIQWVDFSASYEQGLASLEQALHWPERLETT